MPLPANLVSGAQVLAHLTPMKRILCLCPVVADTCSDSNQGACNVGIAVSDPYLARATPVVMNNSSSTAGQQGGNQHPLEVYWHSCNSAPYHTFPKTSNEFTKLVDYSDVGAIALALPMRNSLDSSKYQQDDASLAQATRHYLVQNILKNYWNRRFGGNGLVCYIDERLTLNDVRERANEDQDMWEDIVCMIPDIDATQQSSNLHPSLHAAVALNQFLWHQTGGWQNTFG